MSYKAQKRKHKPSAPRYHERNSDDVPESSNASLYIQAYEADLVRGVHALASAHSLEVERDSTGKTTRVGSGLMQWDPSAGTSTNDGQPNGGLGNGRDEVWVDRYDARLLLEELPVFSSGPTPAERYSPTGWSDLPSDTEDTFFFDPDEVEEYQREKRRKLIDQSREDRLRALQDEDEPGAPQEDIWGGSDEEPDDTQKELMRRTASHIISSPNPPQLEMRILANHGNDQRFAFLRGRWSRAWKTMKGRIRLEKEREKAEEKKSNGILGGLTGYGESDDGSSNDEQEDDADSQPPQIPEPTPVVDIVADEAAKEARRARARKWAENRRMQQSENKA